jgi:signal transduction histidine kinase
MQRLLGLLRDDGEQPGVSPPPRLAQIHELVQRVHEAGLAMTLRVDGDPVPLESGIDLSAYRVVQEALTNSVKHARGATAHVTITYTARELALEVLDDGGTRVNGVGGAGRGLAGMRERVSFYGGTLDHGPRDGGGFRVHATFPL